MPNDSTAHLVCAGYSPVTAQDAQMVKRPRLSLKVAVAPVPTTVRPRRGRTVVEFGSRASTPAIARTGDVLRVLRQTWPKAFRGRAPLQVRIHAEVFRNKDHVVAALAEVGLRVNGDSHLRNLVYMAIGRHVSRPSYQEAVAKGQARVDLKGKRIGAGRAANGTAN